MSSRPLLSRIAVLSGLLLGIFYAAPSPGEELPGTGKTVTPARPTWDTGYFYVEIYDRAIEALGYTVKKPVTLDNPAFYSAVALGDVDFWVETDVPLHNVYLDKLNGRAQVVGYVAKGETQGYVVDKKSVEQFNIKTIDDFKRPEIVAAFDSNHTGKADLVACPPGWGCELVIDHQIDAYGLKNFVNPIKAAYSASMADAVGKFKTGKPIFAYMWTPSWMAGILKPGRDVVWLEVPFPSLPPDQKSAEPSTIIPNLAGCLGDHNPCKLGWTSFDVVPLANTKFLEANPAIKRLLEVAHIPLEDISEENLKMYQGENKEADIQRHATDWINSHRQEFDGWIAEARKVAAK